MSAFFRFPGLADVVLAFSVFLVISHNDFSIFLISIVAIVRVLIFIAIRYRLGGVFSSKGLSYDVLLAALSAFYLLFWMKANLTSMLMIYMCSAAMTELLCVIFISKWRVTK